MTEDETVVIPYNGVYIHTVATVLEQVAPSIIPSHRGGVCKAILDALQAEGMLTGSPLRTQVISWRDRAIAAERMRDRANRQAAMLLHTRSWQHMKAQLELDHALEVVRAAEVWRSELSPDDPDADSKSRRDLAVAVDEWLEFNYDASGDEAEDQDPGPESTDSQPESEDPKPEAGVHPEAPAEEPGQ